MAEQLANSLATTTLAEDLAIDGLELTLADDAEFPTGPTFRVALFNNRYNPTAIELVTVTAGGSGVAFPWTITRAEEGTTAAAWSTGDYAACVATAAGLSAWILESMTTYAATLTGPAGPQGEPGPQGEAGPIGPEGPAGPQGEQGIQGPAGADGADGAAGPQGEQGPAGAQGPAGPAGADGAPGAAGADGADGASAYEVAVANGYEGTQEAWLASLVGPQGPAGAAGADGADGAQGPQGEQGLQGIQGPAGADGADAPDTFTGLTDTPAAYTDQGGKLVAVNEAATALEFVTAPASGMTNPMTTAGDIIVGGADGAAGRLGKGSDGQVLKMVSGSVAWGTDSTGEGGAGDASEVTYSPAVAADWDSDTDPGNVDDALDQLAERVKDVEGASPGGGAAILEVQVFS